MENFNLLGWDESGERGGVGWRWQAEERGMERAEVRRGDRIDGMDEGEGWKGER